MFPTISAVRTMEGFSSPSSAALSGGGVGVSGGGTRAPRPPTRTGAPVGSSATAGTSTGSSAMPRPMAPSPADDAQQGSEADVEDRAREPVPLPDVPEPSAEEVARHCLTHLPYKRWCRWCVMARRLGLSHRKLPPFSRSIPLFVMDYCFIKHAGDDRWLTVLIGRMYPSRAMLSAPCNHKGADPHVTARLASFFRACGVNSMTYMCDQEEP